MAILDVGSNNPKLSYILAKNPATIRESGKAYRREVRKGVAYGWFNGINDSQFRLWFKDADTQSSFADGLSEEFEYLDRSRYGSPYIPIALITHCLASAAKEQCEDDVTVMPKSESGLEEIKYQAYVRTTIKVSNVRYLEQMSVHYSEQGISILSNYLQGRYYEITISAPTVFEVLNVLQVVCILQCLCDDETYLRVDTAAVEKFVKVFNRANSPYYPRYLFQMKAITNRKTFEKLQPDLSAEGMSLKFGDTRQQRFDAVKAELTGGNTLVDIGCGEMFQTLRLANSYDLIYAIDADEERSDNNRGKVEGRKIDNILAIHAEVNSAWVNENLERFEGADVLMTEVLEHLEYEAADSLVQDLLKSNLEKLVITCPNKDFNQFYMLNDDEMRHPDHKFEPTFTEFCDWMVTLAAETGFDGFQVDCRGIGDSVNDISTSMIAVFTKKPAK